MKLDILAIGVHPDDVELGCSGTIINEVKKGKKVGIIDLTQGELGTRGTIETRYAEAAEAGRIMGIHVRGNLKMRDGFFVNDEAHRLQLIRAIREYQPEIVLANALDDRHPDHGRAGKLIADACFLAGLIKIETYNDAGQIQDRWRPKNVFHYIQDRLQEPDFLVDISDVFEQRMQSIEAYTTQFYNPDMENEGPQTYISTPDFRDSVVARARMLGKRIGVRYAEGFTTQKALGIRDLDALIQNET
ncbi:bacillithiol biosynthesis deacetylase BshB1 [Flavihumibacter stibioxidans]|uniref:Bacillithiol biosynthesis deacetylase BshB1 n=1 Tax=Flavihumibacter stibioxidans TaxID=1834163 RepID=A0ABR7M5R9_9BACT|nr:bacillithiol biosynthesis deacetylase BshB1 [Flavihumibacter stibioxidans]MBC6489981.1 bacillithiol biosynthesis deacetylase BshB1 [Flavihumibacter stibioxidans]